MPTLYDAPVCKFVVVIFVDILPLSYANVRDYIRIKDRKEQKSA